MSTPTVQTGDQLIWREKVSWFFIVALANAGLGGLLLILAPSDSWVGQLPSNLLFYSAIGLVGIGLFRFALGRTLLLSDSTLALRHRKLRPVVTVRLPSISLDCWAFCAYRPQGVDVIGQLKQETKAGLSIKGVDANGEPRWLSLNGFPYLDVLCALRDRDVDIPTLFMESTDGEVARLLFGDNGEFSSNLYAVRWRITGTGKKMKIDLTNIGDGRLLYHPERKSFGLSATPIEAKQGEVLAVSLGDRVTIGLYTYTFQRV